MTTAPVSLAHLERDDRFEVLEWCRRHDVTWSALADGRLTFSGDPADLMVILDEAGYLVDGLGEDGGVR